LALYISLFLHQKEEEEEEEKEISHSRLFVVVLATRSSIILN